MAERPTPDPRKWEPSPATRSSGQFPARPTTPPITTSASLSPSPTSGSCRCVPVVPAHRKAPGFRTGRLSCFDAPVRMCAIPAGEFWMGSDAPEGPDNERPRRRVATGGDSIGEGPGTKGAFEPFGGGGGDGGPGGWGDAGAPRGGGRAATAP